MLRTAIIKIDTRYINKPINSDNMKQMLLMIVAIMSILSSCTMPEHPEIRSTSIEANTDTSSIKKKFTIEEINKMKPNYNGFAVFNCSVKYWNGIEYVIVENTNAAIGLMYRKYESCEDHVMCDLMLPFFDNDMRWQSMRMDMVFRLGLEFLDLEDCLNFNHISRITGVGNLLPTSLPTDTSKINVYYSIESVRGEGWEHLYLYNKNSTNKYELKLIMHSSEFGDLIDELFYYNLIEKKNNKLNDE